MSSPQDPLVVPYSDLNAFTIDLTDGVRARKTITGFVVEKLLSDGLTWVDVGVASPYLSANTARVDPSGDDSTGVVGNILQPFKTVQGAITALEALPPINYALILIPHNYVPGDPITTSLANIQFQGTSENDSVEDLVLTANACALLFCNCDSGNITGNCPGGLDVKIDLSAELGGLPGTLTNTGNIRIVSSGGGLATSTVSCPGFAISMQGVNWGREDQGITIDSAGSDVIAVQCVIEDVLAAASITLKDSRLKANTIGVVPVYQDLLLSRYASANAARVDPFGDDSTGMVGDLTKPFLTRQAAITALENSGITFTQGAPAVLLVPMTDTVDNVTTSLQFLAIVGQGTSINLPAMGNINLTGDGTPSGIVLVLNNVYVGDVTANNLSASSSISIEMDSAIISGDTTCTGNLILDSEYTAAIIDANISAPSVSIRGFKGESGQFSPVITAAADGEVQIIDSYVDTVQQCGSLIMQDSFLRVNNSGVTPTHNDFFMNPANFDFSTLPQATSEPAIATGKAWIDTTGGLNIVKVKL